MAKLWINCLFAFFILNLVFGRQASAVPYDYSFTHECLSKPLKPQYNGGIVVNPELNEGLKGWTTIGEAQVEHGESIDGNKYIVASKRNKSSHSFSQIFNLEKDKLYTFSAWLQVSHENADIAAVFKTQTNHETAGWVIAKSGCWSMLKGGIVVNASGPAELYFESNNTGVDIWADSISLQPFTHQEWKSHQDQSIEKFRKTRVRFQAVDQHGQPLPNATVTIKQQRSGFPLGCAINKFILENPAYENWWTPRFKYTVFENDLKWYINEASQGREDYSTADALLEFAKSRGVAVRGHNVLWENTEWLPSWVPNLSPNDLRAAANKRINSVMSRYRGQLFHWDVVNENLHFNFLESKLGPTASADYYKAANSIDGATIPFLNEIETIEVARSVASPVKYLQKISEIRSQGYKGPLGIGLEGHFVNVNLAVTRSAIDQLASAKLPIWVTELDITRSLSPAQQAPLLDQVLKEIHSHAAVQGVMIWSPWTPTGCYQMCLTDNNFRNLPTGDVVDKFRSVLSHADDLPGTTDANGFFETALFHGEYEAKISHPKGDEFFSLHEIKVGPKEDNAYDVYRLAINV